MSSAEEVAERLVALFTTLANRVQVALRERGLSLTCKQEVPVLERGDEGAWSLSEQVRHQPVLLALPVSVTIPPLLTEADADEVVTAAADLHAIDGAHLPFYSPLPGGSFLFPRRGSQFDYEADPQTWLVQHVVMPALHHHLALLTSNNTDDVTQAATAFAREAIEVVTSPVLRYRCVVPLAGLTIPARLTAGKLVVRSLSDEEQGVYAAAQHPVVVRTGFRLPLPFAIGDVPSVMAEIMQDGSRDAHDVDCARGLVSVVVAFALHGYSVSGPGFAGTSSAPPWMMSGHTSSSIMIATRTDKIRTLSQESLQKIHLTAKRLDRYGLVAPSNSQDVALHRFALGCSRAADVDAVVDFVVALEGLLLPYDAETRHGDLSYRFRLHGAVFIEPEPNARPAVRKKLNNLYAMRSRLVHGAGGYPDPDEIRQRRQDAYELAARGLRRAVEVGFPTPESLNDLILPTTTETGAAPT